MMIDPINTLRYNCAEATFSSFEYKGQMVFNVPCYSNSSIIIKESKISIEIITIQFNPIIFKCNCSNQIVIVMLTK